MHQQTESALVQVMACRLFGSKPLPEPMLAYSQLDHSKQNISEFRIKIQTLLFMKMLLKMTSVGWQPFCPGEDELKPNCEQILWSIL